MNSEEKLIFRLTTDLCSKRICAEMMVSTDPWIRLEMDYAQCMMAFEGPYKEIILAEFGDHIAGFAILQTTGSFKGYIQTICISENYRGKGIGRKLLQYCESRILDYSPNVFICVSSFNKRAIKLYTQFGFTVVGELENFVKEGFTELLLRKSVGPLVGYKKFKGKS